MSSNPVTALLPPAHPGEGLTTDPADVSQHPEHPLPPTPASLQQRVTTPGMPRTDSTRRTPNILYTREDNWLDVRCSDRPDMCARLLNASMSFRYVAMPTCWADAALWFDMDLDSMLKHA
jgi:hypothetical protein